MKKRKLKKNLIISVPHAMHARNLFSSSFNFSNTSVILGNFSLKVKKHIKNKTLCDVKNFNLLHLFQSKIISLYTLLLDRDNTNENNTFIRLVKKNYNKTDLNFKKIFKHKRDTIFNKILFSLSNILFLKFILNSIIFFTSILIYSHTIIKYKPKKILFMCSNVFLDKGLFFIAKFFNIKTYGLISSWDHLSTKRFIDVKKFDKIFVWNDYFKKEFKYIYNCDVKNIFPVGLPYYDAKRQKYKKKKIITFFMPNPSMMTAESQYDVIKFLHSYCIKNKINLYIKPHPGIKYSGLKNFRNNKDINFIKPKAISMNLNKTIYETKFVDYELDRIIQQSMVVINFHSTTTLDSIFHLTPVINLSLERNNDWLYEVPYYKYVLNFKAISLAKSFDDLKKNLDKYIKNKNYRKKNIYKLKKLYFGKFNPSSGLTITKLINKN